MEMKVRIVSSQIYPNNLPGLFRRLAVATRAVWYKNPQKAARFYGNIVGKKNKRLEIGLKTADSNNNNNTLRLDTSQPTNP